MISTIDIPKPACRPDQKLNAILILFGFDFLLIYYRLIMQPNILNGTSFGHVIIDIVKDENVKDWPKIVLDINNITIKKAQGNFYFR